MWHKVIFHIYLYIYIYIYIFPSSQVNSKDSRDWLSLSLSLPVVYRRNEAVTLFNQNINFSSLLLEGANLAISVCVCVCVWERERERERDKDEGLWHRTSTKADRGLLYRHFFLATLWVYIQGLTALLFWRKVLSWRPPGTACERPHPQRFCWPNLTNLTTLPTDCSVCGYLRLYNFLAPIRSFRFFFRLSTHVIFFYCSLVFTAGTSCLEILNFL